MNVTVQRLVLPLRFLDVIVPVINGNAFSVVLLSYHIKHKVRPIARPIRLTLIHNQQHIPLHGIRVLFEQRR
jgi:hypothetical protein